MTTWLPDGTAATSDDTALAAAIVVGTCARVDSSRTATGWLRSSAGSAFATIASTSAMSPSTQLTAPPSADLVSASARENAIGSLSVYTIRDRGLIDCANS